jgi:hypothetical protein
MERPFKYIYFNALDKVLIDTNLENWESLCKVIAELQQKKRNRFGR